MVSTTAGFGTTYNPYATGGSDPFSENLITNYFLKLLPMAKNASSLLLARMEKVTRDAVSGRYIVWPAIYGWNTGVNSVGNGGAIPEPGFDRAATHVTLTRKGMARIMLDGDVVEHAKTNGGAYIDAMRLASEQMALAIQMDRARAIHNDGSGRLAQVKTNVGVASTVTLKINQSIEGAATTRAAGTLDADGFISVGMRIGFAETTGGTLRTVYTGQQSAYVVSVATSGNDITITVSNTPTGAAANMLTGVLADDWVVRVGIDTAAIKDSGYRHEIMGIGGVFSDTGTVDGIGAAGTQQTGAGSETLTGTTSTHFQGLTATSATPFNQGIVLDNGGAGNRPLELPLLQTAISDAERINGANVTLMLSSFPTYDSYVNKLQPDKRYVNTTELHGGHKLVDFNGIPWEKDRFCYQNRVFFLAMDQFRIVETTSMRAISLNDESVWQRVVGATDLDKYWRGWKWEDQVIAEVRNRCGAVLVELAA